MSAASAVVALASALFAGAPGAVAAPPKPPPPPTAKQKVTQAQVSTTAAAKFAKATEVGQLNGEIAAAQAQLQSDLAAQELAEQRVAYAYSELLKAQQKEAAAKARVRSAQQDVAAAHQRFVQYIQASYTGGDVRGASGTMLTATNPTALLDESALQQYQSRSKADAIGGMQQATVQQSNAEAMARLAVQTTKRAKKAADAAKAAADQEVAASEARRADLQTEIDQKQQELAVAQQQYAAILQGRHEYVAYQQAVADRNRAIAVFTAYKARQAELARERAAAARRAAAAAAWAKKHPHRRHSGGGGGGGGGGGQSYTAPPSGPSAPSGGGWTAAKGQRAVARAMSTLGTSYAWAGGNQYGPTRGVCDAGNGAPNDCYVNGYDCSGLVMYAWGKGWAHFAATQYHQAGSYHPGAGRLRAGDLVFWSDNGNWAAIHHVAIYKGGGKIIEAPYSGGHVQVRSLYEYGGGFFTTRPLT